MLDDEFKVQLKDDLAPLRGQKGRNLVISVSGGLDSSVLMQLCAKHARDLNNYFEGSIQIIHCNFHLRGQESEEDEALVVAEAQRLGFAVEKHDFWKGEEASAQTWARHKRQAIYRARALKGDIIGLAHHQDDVLENLIFRSIREATIDRVPFFKSFDLKQRIWRPFLRFSKEALVDFAKQNQLVFREDSSNVSLKYSRNIVRHHVIPTLTEISPAAKQHLLSHGKMLEELFEFFDHVFAKEIAQKVLPRAILTRLPELLRLRFLREWMKLQAPETQWVSHQTLQKILDSAEGHETQWEVSPGIFVANAKNQYLLKIRKEQSN